MDGFRLRPRKSLAKAAEIAFAAALIPLFLAGCGDEVAQDRQTMQSGSNSGSNTAPETSERADPEQTKGETMEQEDTAAQPEESVEQAVRGQATLEITGDAGTAFSGTCILGDEENVVSGQVPDSFTYPLDGRRLRCEIRKDGPGNLKITFTAGNDRSVQQTSSDSAVVSFTYSRNGNLSTATSSSGSSSSVNSQSSSSR